MNLIEVYTIELFFNGCKRYRYDTPTGLNYELWSVVVSWMSRCSVLRHCAVYNYSVIVKRDALYM